ncbi:MAG: MoxR family ATPase [Candidatus Hydrogenedentota bacterium]
MSTETGAVSGPNAPDIPTLYQGAVAEFQKVIFGQDDTLRFCVAALLSNGHVLLEGVPGTAKTTLVRTVAASLAMDFSRIQFTPDLLPNDVTGSYVFRPTNGEFEFRPGPVFANFVLADEINRAPAKTQSALLEAMQEGTVSQEKTVHQLPRPFIVFATQNPVEHEGTYPLPLAQLDRFMFKVLVNYPDETAEERVLAEHHANAGSASFSGFGVQPVVNQDDILAAREVIRETFVRPEVVRYVRKLVHATREDPNFLVGASPRAGLTLLMGAKSLARFDGRDYVTPDDIKEAFAPSLRHRLVLSPGSELEDVTVDDALRQVMNSVEVPR